MALGRKASAEPLEQRRHGAPVGGRGAGGDGARERPALSAAPDQGGRARADAPVQREHPGVAERRARGARPQRPGRALEPPDGRALRRPSRGRRRPRARRSCSTRRIVRMLRGQRRRAPEGAAYYRVPLSTRHEPARRLLVNLATTPLRDSHGDVVGTIVIVEDISTARAARGAAADLGEDGVDRPAGRGRGARGQHAADRHLELHADAAREAPARRSVDQGPREDRAADVPRRQDRQRPAEPGAARRRSTAARATSTPSSTTCCRCSSTSSATAASRCARSWRRPRRSCRASSTSCSRSSSTCSSTRATRCRRAAG